jgi:hypothetical protein
MHHCTLKVSLRLLGFLKGSHKQEHDEQSHHGLGSKAPEQFFLRKQLLWLLVVLMLHLEFNLKELSKIHVSYAGALVHHN